MNEIVKEFPVESNEPLPGRPIPAISSKRRSAPNDDPATPLLAPITAPATAVAVPASRRYAAVDPQPVAVMAPTPFRRRTAGIASFELSRRLRKDGGRLHGFESRART